MRSAGGAAQGVLGAQRTQPALRADGGDGDGDDNDAPAAPSEVGEDRRMSFTLYKEVSEIGSVSPRRPLASSPRPPLPFLRVGALHPVAAASPAAERSLRPQLLHQRALAQCHALTFFLSAFFAVVSAAAAAAASQVFEPASVTHCASGCFTRSRKERDANPAAAATAEEEEVFVLKGAKLLELYRAIIPAAQRGAKRGAAGNR